jgi:hypothetical protein
MDKPDHLYHENVAQYEKTRLREFFLEEKRRVEPRWVEVYESEQVRRDMLVAIEYCENHMLCKWAKEWVTAMARRVPKKNLSE